MAEIQFKEITKRYPDGFEAVKQMDLNIGDGEFMILVGPSGCGKSTALRMIAGLEDITEGDLIIGGERVNDLAPRDRDIAMVFQNYALYPHMTVRDNMGFALKLAKAPKDEIDRKVTEAPGPQAGEPLGRPAPARRHGPRDRARSEGVPHGRAALEPRRQATRPDAHGGRAHPAHARHDDGLRHPRPDRGDDAGRPRRGHARGHHPAGRHAGQPL
jgi:ABC-type dipeptide/oligopeptide/nickel transport system ATPase component